MSGRSRAWVFTWNNPPKDKIGVNIVPEAEYLVYQLERGESGTLHLQGSVYYKNARTLVGVVKTLNGAHCAIMAGTWEQSETYCTKEESRVEGPWRFGRKPSQGGRTDLEEIRKKISSGASRLAIADEHFASWCRYNRSFDQYRLLTGHANRSWLTETIVYWGPSGSGKTRHALEIAGPTSYWLAPPRAYGNAVWWDGYDGQDTVVIDEFYGWFDNDFMCRLCDRYPLVVQTKGGSASMLAKRVIITSNLPPDMWWKRGLRAMERRLKGENGYVFFVGKAGQTEEEYRETLEPPMYSNASFNQAN